MKIVCSIEIDAPISKVFEVLNDADQHKLWLHGLEETIREPGYDPKHPLGSKFTQKIRDGKKLEVYDGEVVAYEKPRHLGVHVSNGGMTAKVDYQLKSLKKKTQLEFTSDLQFKSLAFKLLVNLSQPVIRGIIEKQLASLKKLVEAEQ
jgi:uncharacterized protein YndB with AHSA1/START domain